MKKITALILAAVVIFGSLSFSSCQKEKGLTVILHAGGGKEGLTYLNATETFYEYYEAGYRYFEYDLMLSSDGRIIGSHGGEHLGGADPEDITYAEFKGLTLTNGLTPVTEEWLVEIIRNYPDVKIVVDAKMPTTEGDAAVLIRLCELEAVYGTDISKSIIPEVFSLEMWELIKDKTDFYGYFYSQYKVYYNTQMILDYFGSEERIIGVCFPDYVDSDLRAGFSLLKEAGKEIYIFTCDDKKELEYIKEIGASGYYADFPKELK